MNKQKLLPLLTSGILIAAFFAVALFIRIYLPLTRVITPEWIKFSGSDAYSHMRLIENLVHNFPHLTTFDPYWVYPGGASTGSINLYDWLAAAIAWLIGLGSPSEHTINLVGAYFPTILGALTIIPAYFIGKELFNRPAGIIAAGLVALLPGEFLGRSILGFTDHHVAETLLTTVVMLFLILAIKSANKNQITFEHLKQRNWALIARPLVYSLLAGIFLGIFLHTWAGGLLFVFIISLYFVFQFIIDHLKKRNTDYLCIISVPLILIAAIIFLPVYRSNFYVLPLLIAFISPLLLNGISRLLASRGIKVGYYPLTLVGLGLAGFGIFYLIGRSLLETIIETLKFFIPSGAALTTIEMQSIMTVLVPGGNFFETAAWGNFNTTIFFSLIGLIFILLYFVIKKGNAEKTLLIVWSLVVLLATIGQRRFAYYFVINAALLTGYASVLVYYGLSLVFRGTKTGYWSAQVFELPSFNQALTQPARVLERVKRKRAERLERKQAKRIEKERNRPQPPEPKFQLTGTHAVISLWVAFVLFFVAFFPSPKAVANAADSGSTQSSAWWRTTVVGMAIATASQAQYVPSDAWCNSLDWMRENTPDPFGDPDFFYNLETSKKYRSLSELEKTVPNPSADPRFYSSLDSNYPYPPSAYGVLSWWDYGYWINYIGHRIPNANPAQDPRAVKKVAAFFTASNETSANKITDELGTKYIIVDLETATSKFWAIAEWADRRQNEYFDVYLVPQPEQSRFVARLFYYPAYYEAFSTRLFNFDGKAVTPGNVSVINYREMPDKNGTMYKVISDQKSFNTYAEAETYVASQTSGEYKIASENPFESIVPLDALQHYNLVHSSNETIAISASQQVSEVKIFEYLK